MTPALVLFDFDDVLAGYSHADRIAHLADGCGVPHALVSEVLFESGLEGEYDSGLIDTSTYLHRLGEGLGRPVGEALWIGSRVAGSRTDPEIVRQVLAVATQARIGVLTNNGALLAEATRSILPDLYPALDGAVLCSGALRVRKPDAAIYRHALDHFGVDAGRTLFVDDKPENVEAARTLGMHAEQTTDAATLAAALRRHGFAA